MTPFRLSEQARSQLPEHCTLELERWVNEGRRSSGPHQLSRFYSALLSGDYLTAATHADTEILAAFGHLLRVMATELPFGSFGSVEIVQHWQGTQGSRRNLVLHPLESRSDDAGSETRRGNAPYSWLYD